MNRLLTKMLKQTAVYWSPGSGFDAYGQPVWGEPVELLCRWEDTNVEFIDPQGTRQVSQARVFVGQDLEVGGVLMLGSTADTDSSLDPKANPGAFEIRSVSKAPDLRASRFLRTVML